MRRLLINWTICQMMISNINTLEWPEEEVSTCHHIHGHIDLICNSGGGIEVINAVAQPLPTDSTLECVNNNKATCTKNLSEEVKARCSGKRYCKWKISKNWSRARHLRQSKFCCVNLPCNTIRFKCIPGQCDPLPPPLNGYVSVSDSAQTIGTIATYYCHDNYVLHGETTRTCSMQTDYAYRWNHLEPDSIPMCNIDHTLCSSPRGIRTTEIYALGNTCYKLNGKKDYTYSQANARCSRDGWELATLDNNRIYNRIIDHIVQTINWIGDPGEDGNIYWIGVGKASQPKACYFVNLDKDHVDPKKQIVQYEVGDSCNQMNGYICQYNISKHEYWTEKATHTREESQYEKRTEPRMNKILDKAKTTPEIDELQYKYTTTPEIDKPQYKYTTIPEIDEAQYKYTTTLKIDEPQYKYKTTPKIDEPQYKYTTTPEIDESQYKYTTTPKLDELQYKYTTTPKIDESLFTTTPKIDESQYRYTTTPKLDESQYKYTTKPKIDQSQYKYTTTPKLDESQERSRVLPKIDESKYEGKGKLKTHDKDRAKSEIDESQYKYTMTPKLDKSQYKYPTTPKIDESQYKYTMTPKIDESHERRRLLPKIDESRYGDKSNLKQDETHGKNKATPERDESQNEDKTAPKIDELQYNKKITMSERNDTKYKYKATPKIDKSTLKTDESQDKYEAVPSKDKSENEGIPSSEIYGSNNKNRTMSRTYKSQEPIPKGKKSQENHRHSTYKAKDKDRTMLELDKSSSRSLLRKPGKPIIVCKTCETKIHHRRKKHNDTDMHHGKKLHHGKKSHHMMLNNRQNTTFSIFSNILNLMLKLHDFGEDIILIRAKRPHGNKDMSMKLFGTPGVGNEIKRIIGRKRRIRRLFVHKYKKRANS
ncbi:unnamed protein product [Owenia fusiformis]|uniref:Sushi domain-containing protein n=1 Tax=Owenia fusiformis TaxID=6347 RepID=A0A8S4QBS9_OWEFU|nr:unnamed protein product [Owenia fusiformis]